MKNLIERDKKRRLLVAKYEQKRTILKALTFKGSLSKTIRFKASLELSSLPKNSSKTRLNNRCTVTGRGKAVLRSFRISRIALRTFGSCGLVSGFTKSSW
jgi:small subunit ribosomal protein S14